MIAAGAAAPDFTLSDQDGVPVTLSGLRGTRVLLVFYPLDFSPVCSDQFAAYQDRLSEMRDAGAELFGISVDSAFSHKAFQDRLGVSIPLLSDFHPKGEVARSYGVYIDARGHSQRALVLIDPQGSVEWSHQSPSPLEIPSADLVLEALGPR